MLLTIDALLDSDSLRHFAKALASAEWIDGRSTAGGLASSAKSNQQLAVDAPTAVALGNQLLRVLGRHPSFISAALPERIYPPKFNRYSDGGHYGTHVDAAIMRIEANGQTLRSDLAATVFLTDPADYDGGELLIETDFGAQAVKLPAGSMVLYPASSLHQVSPVTRGARVAAFFWVQSLVRDASERALLFDLDQSIQSLGAELAAGDARLLALTATYHNLLRRWSTP
jgi:PKHD-type hydroxylase